MYILATMKGQGPEENKVLQFFIHIIITLVLISRDRRIQATLKLMQDAVHSGTIHWSVVLGCVLFEIQFLLSGLRRKRKCSQEVNGVHSQSFTCLNRTQHPELVI